MSRVTIINARLVTPQGVLANGYLTIEDGRIAAFGDMSGAGASPRGGGLLDIGGDHLVPGFIDTQVNGGGGRLFNDAPSVDTIATIGAAHAAHGTTGFLPTLISDDLDVIDAAMRAVEAAIDQGVPGVLGIHVEGPFIAKARKGIHDPAKFRRLDAAAIDLLTSLRRGRALVTLAPELCGTSDIAALAGAGVIVAAGHTDADHATMRAALDAGVTGFTHLFNAMSPMLHRAPGVVGAALDDQASYCGLIADGHHVDPAVLRIVLRARPIDRCMLVSDAMPAVGSAHRSFPLNGVTIEVRDGVCVGPDGTLAGCDLTMALAVRNIMTMTGIGIEAASMMASLAPARFLRLDDVTGSIKVGRAADLVWLGREGEAKGVWQNGRLNAAQSAAA